MWWWDIYDGIFSPSKNNLDWLLHTLSRSLLISMSIDLLYHSSIYEFIIAKLFSSHKLTAIIFSQNNRGLNGVSRRELTRQNVMTKRQHRGKKRKNRKVIFYDNFPKIWEKYTFILCITNGDEMKSFDRNDSLFTLSDDLLRHIRQ